MAVYQYEGKVYQLPDGLSNEEAIAKIEAYLGKSAQTQRAPASVQAGSSFDMEMGAGADTREAQGFRWAGPSDIINALRTQPILEPFTRQAIRGAVVDPINAIRQFTTEGQRQAVAREEAAYQAERAALGEEGTEYGRFVGNVLSPISLKAGELAMRGVGGLGRIAQLRQAAGAGLAGAALTPVLDAEADFADQKVKQLGVGAVLGAFVEGGIQGITGGVNFLREFAKPLTEKGRDTLLRDYLKKLTGPERDQVLKALQNADEIVAGSRPTASEAVADIPSATQLSSFQRTLAREQAPLFATREAEQEAARLAALGADDTTAPLMRLMRESRTAPLREEALNQANIAGDLVPRLERDIASREATQAAAERARQQFTSIGSQQQVLSGREFTPVPGFPRVSSRYRPNIDRAAEAINAAKDAGDIATQKASEAAFKRLQLQSLKDEGFYALKVDNVVNKIDDILRTPGERSDVTLKTLSGLKEKLNAFSNKATGVIDSRDLYTIRKEIADDIKKFAEETKTSDVRRLAGLETNLKKLMDDAIEGAGGVRWKDYLKNYADYSEKINRAEIGTFLQDKLRTSIGDKERAGVFAQAINDAAGTIKKATGASRYRNLGEVLTPDETVAVNKVLADLQRSAKAGRLEGKASVTGLNGEELADLPNLLSRTAAIANFLMKAVKRNATDEINARAAELFLNPQQLAIFMQQPNAAGAISSIFRKLDPQMRDYLERLVTVQFTQQSVEAPE